MHRNYGFDALVLNTGAEAIKVLEAGYPLDVLLLDVRSPALTPTPSPASRWVLVKPFSTSELGRALGVQPR